MKKSPSKQTGLYCYSCGTKLVKKFDCPNVECPVHTADELLNGDPYENDAKYVAIDYASIESKVLAMGLLPHQGKTLNIGEKHFDKIKKFGQMYGMGKDKFLSAYMEGDGLTEAKLAEYYKILSAQYSANDMGTDPHPEPEFAVEWFDLNKPYPTQGGDIVTLIGHGTYCSTDAAGRTYKNDPSSEYHGHVVVSVDGAPHYSSSESPLNLIPEPLFTWLDNAGHADNHEAE